MVSYIYEVIGNILGEQKPPEELGDPIDFDPGVLVDSGISWIHTFRRCLIPVELRTCRLCPSNCKNCKNYCNCKV